MIGLIHERFLLQSEEAARLYFDYAAELPIIDFHTHLPPAEIAADARWENITQVWLYGDHYKWREMRANGVAERFCTGAATDREKFDAFAGIMPYLLRNPLYHWCHLELARYFQIDDLLLSADTADAVAKDTPQERLRELWKIAEPLHENHNDVRRLHKLMLREIVAILTEPTRKTID